MLIGRFFSNGSDIAHWWRAKKSKVSNWSAFCTAFKNYEAVDFNYDLLLSQLYEKTQKLDEPFETFAWDVHAKFMKIDKHTPDKSIIDRIVAACLPELSTDLRSLKCTSVEALVTQARVLIADLNRYRKLEKKIPFRARQSDPIYKFPETSNKFKRPFKHTDNKNSQEENSSKPAEADKNSSDKADKQKQYCTFCKRDTHDTAECRRKAYADKRKQNGQSTSPANSADNAATNANLNF